MSNLRSQTFFQAGVGGTVNSVINLTGMASGDTMIAVAVSVNTVTDFSISGSGWNTPMPKTVFNTRTMWVWAKAWAGETSVTLTPTGDGARKFAIVTLRGANTDYSTWKIGAIGTRAASGGTTATTAPAVTTTLSDSMVVSIFGEATNLQEPAHPTLSSGTEWLYVGQPATDNQDIETILIGTKDQNSPGTVSAVTATYPNPHAFNGLGMQIAVPSATPTAAPVINPLTAQTANPGDEVIFTATLQSGGQPESWAWVQKSGVPVTLREANSNTVTFRAPSQDPPSSVATPPASHAVVLGVTATTGGQTSTQQTATTTVSPQNRWSYPWVGARHIHIAPPDLPPVVEDTVFSIAVIPDTQDETSTSRTDFNSRATWLINNKSALDLRYVIQVGDLANWGEVDETHYQKAVPDIDRIMAAGLPWTAAPGNHDTGAVCPGPPEHPEWSGSGCSTNGVTAAGPGVPYGDNHANVRHTTKWNKHFPPSKFTNFGGAYEGKTDNSWYSFSAGGKDWIVISLEFCARQGAIDWVEGVISTHPNHNVIVVTHYYLNSDSSVGTYNDSYGDKTPTDYHTMFKKYDNVKLILCGHVGGHGIRESTMNSGKKFLTLLQCYHSSTNPVRIVTIDTVKGNIDSFVYCPKTNETWSKDATSTTGMVFV